MIEWYTFQALADELGEKLAAQLMRYATHRNFDGDLVLERDRVEELPALHKREKGENGDISYP